MESLIEVIALYLKKKGLTLALNVLLIVSLIGWIVMSALTFWPEPSEPSDKERKKEPPIATPTSPPQSSSESIKIAVQEDDVSRAPRLPNQHGDSVATSQENNNDEIIGNFTLFDRKLIIALTPSYGQSFAEALSRRIHDNLTHGRTELRAIERAVIETLGNEKADEESTKITKQVVDTIVQVANETGLRGDAQPEK